MSRPLFNRVTEHPPVKDELWLVSATWRGGHDSRLFRLDNLFGTQDAALADYRRLCENQSNFRDYVVSSPVLFGRATP